MKKLVLLFFLVAFISCGKLPETRYFTLNYDMEQQPEAGHGILFVKKFQTDPIYNNDKMIYKVSDYEVKFDNYRRWVLTPGDMLTVQATDHLRHSGMFDWVTNLPPRNREYKVLDGRVIHFEEIYEKEKRFVDVGIVFAMYLSHSEVPVLNKTIEQRVEITQPGVNGIVSAMSKATQMVLDQLVSDLKYQGPGNDQ